jgi:hypothetical protein
MTARGARLARELEDVKLERRVEAALEVARERDKLGAGDRSHLGWMLAELLKSHDMELRSAARPVGALVACGRQRFWSGRRGAGR